ncbi:hypothetical protein UFOVP1236_3 [uncultured Caudovirales phage]|uniref:Uncharacterized protein n=1 Tax=uncultured Caudovirales phage TaxID=2100421 RepID=A0A6J5R577_9CAUD|nr:hypothetical protein UFOVP1236_3 [uncultured Caudovirales phage]
MRKCAARLVWLACVCAVVAVGCAVVPAPASVPAVAQLDPSAVADCAALWRDELGREIDQAASADCASFLSRGLRTLEDYRASIRAGNEYAAYRARLDAEQVVVLPRLVPVGQYFRLETGQRFTWIGATDFNLLARYVQGEDIRPVLAQRRDTGFNALRVFTSFNVCPSGNGCQPIGRLAPTPLMYQSIPPFMALLARYGLYAELVAFAGFPRDVLPTDDAAVAHWDTLIATVVGISNVTLEMANEYNHPLNAGMPPLARLRRPPAGIIASHGSGTQDELPLQPFWDYATYRPGAGLEAARKIAHNAMEDVADLFGLPTVANETIRFPDSDSNPDHAFDAAAGAALLSAGATFHSVHGKNSTLWTGAELVAARAWAAGARSVALECQGQPYVRLDNPDFLRVYRRGPCEVRIRR